MVPGKIVLKVLSNRNYFLFAYNLCCPGPLKWPEIYLLEILKSMPFFKKVLCLLALCKE